MELESGIFDILCVEDDEVDIQNIRREFKKVNENLKIAVANDGVEALDMLYGRNGKKKLDPTPKIILLDINLPKMDGIEFLKTLKTYPMLDYTHVYILTSAYDTHRKIAMRDIHVSGWFVKPLEYADALTVFWALSA